MADCFNGLIGITRNPQCPCITDVISDDLKASKHDLFLDELNGGITLESIKSVSDCGSTLLTHFTNAISGAKQFFKADLMAELASRYKVASDPFTGYVGSRAFARTRILSTAYAGIKWDVRPKIGAYFTISRFALFMDASKDITLRVIKRKAIYGTSDFVDEELISYEITTTANTEKVHELTEALVLPMFELDGTQLSYFFIYERVDGINPKDNSARCNCGASEVKLHSYINPMGVDGSLTALGDMSTSLAANGVIIFGEARCGSDDVICEAMENSEAVDLITAYAMWYKAGELLLDKVLASPEINRWTMANREHLYGRKSHFRKEYFNRITWIGENINLSSTDCYKCDDAKGIYKAGIFS